jgi:hypothetical protein
MVPRSTVRWAQADAEGHDDYVVLSPVVRRRRSRDSGPTIAAGSSCASTTAARVAVPEHCVNGDVDCGERQEEHEEVEAERRRRSRRAEADAREIVG